MFIDKLISNLKSDDCYYYSWQESISVSFQDAYTKYKAKTGKEPTEKDIYEISNIAAKNFLALLCSE